MARHLNRRRRAYLSRIFEGEELDPKVQELLKKALKMRNKGTRGARTMGENILAARKQANRKGK